jgi:hypothetical protein
VASVQTLRSLFTGTRGLRAALGALFALSFLLPVPAFVPVPQGLPSLALKGVALAVLIVWAVAWMYLSESPIIAVRYIAPIGVVYVLNVIGVMMMHDLRPHTWPIPVIAVCSRLWPLLVIAAIADGILQVRAYSRRPSPGRRAQAPA